MCIYVFLLTFVEGKIEEIINGSKKTHQVQ